MGYELNRAFAETDLRDVYAAVRVPTVVLYRDTIPPTPATPRATGEVLVSRTVNDLVAGSGLAFAERGRRELKDVGEWELYAVV
jgi:hypothetical protein